MTPKPEGLSAALTSEDPEPGLEKCPAMTLNGTYFHHVRFLIAPHTASPPANAVIFFRIQL